MGGALLLFARRRKTPDRPQKKQKKKQKSRKL